MNKIKGIDIRFFADFKKSYIDELLNTYSYIDLYHKLIYDLCELRTKLNVKSLSSLNKNYWLFRGWNEKESELKLQEKKKKRKKPKFTYFQKSFWINRGFTEKDAISKISEIQKNNCEKFNKKRKENPQNYKTSSPMTINFWLNKGFTEEEAKFKIKSQRKLNKEYWLNNGFTEKEAIIKVKEFQKENNEKFNKKRKENPQNYLNTTQLSYWIKKTNGDEIEAKSLLKNRQTTFTLEKCIKKLGEEEGKNRWKNRQNKWKAKVFNSETYIGYGRSNISEHFIEILINKLNILNINTTNIMCRSNEKFIYDKIKKRAYKYDFVYNNKIIEFNGDFWHGNPELFKAENINRVTKLPYAKKWEYDKHKIKIAQQYGYDVLVIWESDFKLNEDKIINECLNFLKQ